MKLLKRALKILYMSIVAMMAACIAAIIAVQSPDVQGMIARKALNLLGGRIDGEIHVGKVMINPNKAIVIKDMAIIDRNPYIDPEGYPPVDTMFKAGYVTACFSIRSLISGIRISSARISNGYFHLTIEPEDRAAEYTDTSGNIVNLKRIFRLGQGNSEKSSDERDVFSIGEIQMESFAFRMKNFTKNPSRFGPEDMNWFDLDVQDINLQGEKLKMKGRTMSGTCTSLSFREKCGYSCDLISGKATVGNGRTAIEEFHLKDSWSVIDIPNITLSSRDISSWSRFISEVRIDADISSSIISMNSLGFFAPALKAFNMAFQVHGHAEGYVNDLAFSDLVFTTTDADAAQGWQDRIGHGISGKISGSIIGLPDSKAMLTEADVIGIRFTSSGLQDFIKGWAPDARLEIGKFCKGNTLTFTGKIKGPIDRLKVNGTLHDGTGGSVKTNLDLRNLTDRRRPIMIAGTVSTDAVDIGKAIGGNIPVGKCDMSSGLSATIGKDTLGLTIDSLRMDRLNVLGYDYTGLAAAGTFSQNAFNGRIVYGDPNLNFLFQGIFSLSSKTRNALYHFYANIGYADLHALKIDSREISRVSLRTQANFTRTASKDILGDIDIQDIVLTDENGVHEVGDIGIASHAGSDLNRVRLSSKFAEASFTGSRYLTGFIRDLQHVTTMRELPSLCSSTATDGETGQYDLSMQLHDTKDILSFFAPGLYVADSTSMTLRMKRNGNLDARFISGRIALKDKYMKNISLTADNSGERLGAVLTAEEIRLSPILTKNNIIRLTAMQDSLDAAVSYDNHTEKANRGEFNAAGRLFRDSRDSIGIIVTLKPSFFLLNSDKWDIEPSELKISGGRYSAKDFRLTSESQGIHVTGGYSTTLSDTLQMKMDNVDISMLNAFTKKDLGIGGKLSGKALIISSPGEKAGILMSMLCDSSSFGGHEVGTVRIASVWDESRRKFNYLCRNQIDSTLTFGLTGDFYPSEKLFEGNLHLNSFNIGYAMPYLSSIFSKVEGSISGDISYSGNFRDMALGSRDLRVNKAVLEVGYTGVEYNAEGPVSLDSKGVRFNNIAISDRYNAGGTVNGSIGWNSFRNVTFDTSIDFSGMEVLNTEESDNPIFYGNVFASGNLGITGPLNALRLSAYARTIGIGDVHIPLSSASSAGTSNLLTFKKPYKKTVIDPYEEMMSRLEAMEKKENDIDIRLRINATPGVDASIEIDKDAGNVLTGNGNGFIELEVRPGSGVFNINGNYSIMSGNYHFVALGIAKRDFTIQEGSAVKFNGDIMDSDLDINAIYKTKASVSTLIADTTSTAGRRTVECGIAITNKIRNPRLDFTITIPDLDPTTQARVESALNTQDKVQKQLLALLVTNSFLPDEQSGITNSSSMLFSNVSEIMAGQLNNILQKLNIPVDFGLDYQQSSGGTDIFDVALSTALFNNRVVVNGTIGNRQYETGNSGSEVVGDLDIDVKLDKPGTLRLNLFSHSADQYTNYLDNSQRNGIGITYQKEFDNMADFIRNIFRSRKKRQEITASRQHETAAQKKVRIKIEPDTLAGDRNERK